MTSAPDTAQRPVPAPGSSAQPLRYLLITPARNEAAFIEQTIRSVVSQTVRPVRWIIVSDGSTDGTDAIVQKYLPDNPWLELLRMPERTERHFAGKVHAFNAGYTQVRNVPHDIVGSLDADITFDAGYFAYLLGKFAENPQLGVAGTPFSEDGTTYDYRFSRKEHVSGACQLFRRECFESIGGYVPIKAGGIDLTAVVTARMKGWRTETFIDKVSVHHRRMGSAKDPIYRAQFKSGYGDYLLGVHPVWQVFRSVYQMSRTPVFVGGCLLLVGYAWAVLTRAQKPVSPEFVRFRRTEQMTWLGAYLKRTVLWR